MKNFIFLAIIALTSCVSTTKNDVKWTKYEGNPVLGGPELGTIFDISVLKDDGVYKMYCSWRPQRSIALATSTDGIHWSQPEIVLTPDTTLWWEKGQINRIAVLKKDDLYHLWYTGQARDSSWIGYATSPDGIRFTRKSAEPVLKPELEWEHVAVMCPHVNWDNEKQLYSMWYSGGEQNEPNAIGYATSPDGLNWTKHSDNPVFAADPASEWEQHKVTACQVIKRKNDYLMFYIGFQTEDRAQIGMAKSPDGIGNWTRFEGNPIVAPTPDSWDADACYKPFAIHDGKRWLLWYNGRYTINEYIGLVIFDNDDLGF
jgi:predicted GH43/DUF377 family glycosyl hydrolase